MIIEQAFLKLPEILSGSHYPIQDYEGGIVGAFSLALLQQLNGNNLNSPLAAIQQERLFRKNNFWNGPDGNPRHLRADLHLNLKGFRTASRGLSAYGWRHNNWVEAKFFRAGTTGQMQNTASLLTDLIRLMTLVPIERSKQDQTRTNSGRYLLHVYHGQPSDYLSISRNYDGVREERRWLSPLLEYGRWDTNGFVRIADETKGILRQINAQLRNLEIKFVCTNLIVEPIDDLPMESFYCCVLTRLDSFSVRYNEQVWTVREDRTYSDQATYRAISDFVGAYISAKESENTPATEDETSQDVEEIGGGVEVGGGIDIVQQNAGVQDE
jgi:hypothetical protein